MSAIEVDVEQHRLCFETLANELRLDIIRLLEEHGAMNVTQLAKLTEAERSRVSHALQALRQCNIVETEKKGREIIYTINKKTPLFKEHKGNIFSLLQEHARYCPSCPRHSAYKR